MTTDPAAPVASDPDATALSAAVPVLLLPVRVETRFVRTARVRPAADRPLAAEAVALVGPGAEEIAELLVRIYPDTVSTSSFEPELTDGEVSAGAAYWHQLWYAGQPPAGLDAAHGAWRALASAYGSQRAAWIVRTMAPSNLGDRPPALADPHDGGVPAPALPDPARRASSFERVPTTTGLPDLWVVYLERDGVERSVRGGAITPDLAVGLTPHDGVLPDGLTVDAGMRWLVDFATAETVGMGIRVPLSDEEAAGGFDRILVLGVRGTAKDATGDTVLRRMLDDHHYTDGIAFVPQGAPTNNTSDAASAFDRQDPDQAVSFSVEVGADLSTGTAADGPVAAAALGLAGDVFAHVRYADGYGGRNGTDMVTALWPATLGYFLEQLMDPVFDPVLQDAMRRFAISYALPRGPLPAVRVGSTPYGVLPVTSLAVLNAAVAPRGQTVQQRERALLGAFVARLLPSWQAGEPATPHIGRSNDPDQDLAEVLAMEASSVTVRGRQAVGDDAMWNIVTFLGQSDDSTQESWQEHLTRGRALLDSLGLTSWNPRVIQTSMGRDSFPVPFPTVQDAPLSETDPLAADATLADVAVNYVQWLSRAPMDDVWGESYPGPKPTSVLYRLLRQSMLREYVTQAGRGQVQDGVLSTAALREVELVHMQPAIPTVTALDIVSRPVSANATLTWAQHLDTVGPAPWPDPESPLARLADLRASMERLALLPTAELDRTLTETLDAASHRLDVWVTALGTSLLAEQRTASASAPAGTATLHLGGYGWVEDVRPAAPAAAVTGPDASAVARMDAARATLTSGTAPRPVSVAHADNGGFLQAPSMTQAAAGAVLRSGYLSHRGTTDESALAISLTSARTRSALWLLAGVRQGVSLGALTGFQFEQQLHELHLDTYMQPFRDAYPLVGDELTGETANGAVLPPSQVVDGGKLRAAWQAGQLTPGASWGAGLPAAGSPDQTAVVGVLTAIDGMLDALNDVSIAESVFQIMRGNYGRAGGILDAVSRGDHPPDPDIVGTPRPGLDVTHRLMLLMAGAPTTPPAWSPITVRPRALLEPWLSSWVASQLPDPATVRARASWTTGPADQPQPHTVTVSLLQLDVGPLDVLAVADASDRPQRAELETRIVRAAAPPADATAVVIGYAPDQLPAGSVTFPALLAAARAIRDLVGAARPLDLPDLAMPDRTPTSGSVDLGELSGRVAALVAALQADLATLGAAGTALQADPTDAGKAATLADGLLMVTSYACPTAIPSAGTPAEGLLAQAARVHDELSARLAAVPATVTTPEVARAAATTILGTGVLLVPHLNPPDLAGLQSGFAQSAAMQAVDPDAVRRWILQLAHVRPAVQRYDLATSSARLLGAGRPVLRLAQLPPTPADRWLGLPLDGGVMPGHGRVALEAVAVGDPATQPVYAGLVLDEWLDRIPGMATTTGVAFHFDEPTARAPQTMLLAVCPDQRPTWDVGLLRTIVAETLDLAKVRAVDLLTVQDVGQILPALYVPFNLQGPTPATHFFEVVQDHVVARAHLQ